jgi:hypothetical protein
MKPGVKIALGIAIGAVLGFCFYYFVGCKSGSCPITGNPYISTLYGAVVGILVVGQSPKNSRSE